MPKQGHGTAGPRDPRGELLEEMMVAYNLVVANQAGVHTYEKGLAKIGRAHV